MTTDSNNRYWPFDSSVILDAEEKNFFESVTEKGFKAFQFDINNCGARSGEREGWIIVRGRRRWEIRLAEGNIWRLSAYIADFNTASRAINKWLDGAEPEEIVTDIHDVLVVPSGARSSYTLHIDNENKN